MIILFITSCKSFSTKWDMVACGSGHTVAIKTDGTLWAWGDNSSGQLGLKYDKINKNYPVLVGTKNNWAKVICSDLRTVAIKTDDTLWAWGDNSNSQLGLGDINDRDIPVQVGNSADWTRVSCGGITAYSMSGRRIMVMKSHTIGVKANGTLWTWGYNVDGQLGLGDSGNNTNRRLPTQVGKDSNWSQVTNSGWHTMAIKTDGTLCAWGDNWFGQLGLGDTITRTLPTQIGTNKDWAMVACGSGHTVSIKTDGTLWAWGDNLAGQLGLGDTITRTLPTQIGTNKDWAMVACGSGHTVAIKTDGTLWVWGDNVFGQLGLGMADENTHSSPVQFGIDNDWEHVSCGEVHTVAIKTDGTLWAWGDNVFGQLGLGDTKNRNIPTQINK